MIIQYSGISIDTRNRTVRYSRNQHDDIALCGLVEKVRGIDHRLDDAPMIRHTPEFRAPWAEFSPGWTGIDKDTETEAEPRRRFPEENDE